MKPFEPSGDSALAGGAYQAFAAVDYTADMLQCTIQPGDEPDRFGHLFVERIARDMRNQYIAGLLSRAKNALAVCFARRAPATWSPSR